MSQWLQRPPFEASGLHETRQRWCSHTNTSTHYWYWEDEHTGENFCDLSDVCEFCGKEVSRSVQFLWARRSIQ